MNKERKVFHSGKTVGENLKKIHKDELIRWDENLNDKNLNKQNRKTERQKDRKTERQKDRKTERQKDRKTERQKDRKVAR